MKSNININIAKQFILGMVLVFFSACQNDSSDLETATYSTNPDVFIDAFSTGLNYSAFGGSYTSGFQADTEVTYNNSSTSMRFDVPNSDNAEGSYVGGAFYTTIGRDLSGYDCLTFYAKATTGTSIGTIGFGNDYDTSTYIASVSDLDITTAWKKYYIPIPDASKLTIEKGLLYLAASPDSDGNGYSFWLDEVKFENLGTINHESSSIMSGEDSSATVLEGDTETIDGLSSSFSIPTGEIESVTLAAAYFDFSSSDTSVATVDSDGVVTAVGLGTAVITASLAGTTSTGSLTITCATTTTTTSLSVAAPTPTTDSSSVISIYSDAYTNVSGTNFNTYWGQSTVYTEVTIDGNYTLKYAGLDYQGIELGSSQDVSSKTYLHLDYYTSDSTSLSVYLISTGPLEESYALTVPTSGVWVSVDIPLTSFSSVVDLSDVIQFKFVGNGDVYIDNIYFH